jgi:hypothetical protein
VACAGSGRGRGRGERRGSSRREGARATVVMGDVVDEGRVRAHHRRVVRRARRDRRLVCNVGIGEGRGIGRNVGLPNGTWCNAVICARTFLLCRAALPRHDRPADPSCSSLRSRVCARARGYRRTTRRKPPSAGCAGTWRSRVPSPRCARQHRGTWT